MNTCWISGFPCSAGPVTTPQILRHLDLATAAVGSRGREDLALQMRLGRVQQNVAHGIAGEEG